MRHVSVKHVVIQLLGQRILFSYLNPTLRNRGFHGKDKVTFGTNYHLRNYNMKIFVPLNNLLVGYSIQDFP